MKTGSITDEDIYQTSIDLMRNLVWLARNQNAFFSKWDVSFNTFEILEYLYTRTGGVPVTELEDNLMIPGQTMNAIIDGMEGKGVLERVRVSHPASSGIVIIRLKPEGRKKVRVLRRQTCIAVKVTQATLDKSDMRELIDLTQKLVEFWDRAATAYKGPVAEF
jgi:DNA-binding MarR family transcriptional regulator